MSSLRVSGPAVFIRGTTSERFLVARHGPTAATIAGVDVSIRVDTIINASECIECTRRFPRDRATSLMSYNRNNTESAPSRQGGARKCYYTCNKSSTNVVVSSCHGRRIGRYCYDVNAVKMYSAVELLVKYGAPKNHGKVYSWL